MSGRDEVLTETEREVLRAKASQQGMDGVILYVERIIAQRLSNGCGCRHGAGAERFCERCVRHGARNAFERSAMRSS